MQTTCITLVRKGVALCLIAWLVPFMTQAQVVNSHVEKPRPMFTIDDRLPNWQRSFSLKDLFINQVAPICTSSGCQAALKDVQNDLYYARQTYGTPDWNASTVVEYRAASAQHLHALRRELFKLYYQLNKKSRQVGAQGLLGSSGVKANDEDGCDGDDGSCAPDPTNDGWDGIDTGGDGGGVAPEPMAPCEQCNAVRDAGLAVCGLNLVAPGMGAILAAICVGAVIYGYEQCISSVC
jgi:hypothetical protein